MSVFLRENGGEITFQFRCECCGGEGELTLEAKDRGPFACPEGCGACYLAWRTNHNWALRCVFRPYLGRRPS